MTVDCAAFEAEAADLALGTTPEPARAALLDHAAGCRRCASLIDGLARTVDALVELAPEVEPPVGFESRAVAAMGPLASLRPARRRGRRLAASVAAAVVVLVVGFAAGAARSSGGQDHIAGAVVRAADGHRFGRVEVVSVPSPRVVVLADGEASWRGTWTCELQRGDGTWVAVGTWTASDAPTGAWSVPIDGRLADDAVAMRITADGGRFVVATSDRIR